MKYFFSLLMFLLCGLTLMAQENERYIVEGILIDSIAAQPESFATVRLMKDGQTEPIKVGITDAEGKFRLSAGKAGTYRLICTSIGKRNVERVVTVAAKGIDVGRLMMQTDETVLGAVKVRAQKPLVKAEIDKLTYSIADDPDAQTNSLIEMLRKVPMVTVDGEDNIQVNGNSSFKVYVNGKPNQMMSANPSEIFKNYPASAIKKIEVITNPGAKYDAEGTAGVLNIITNTETTTSGYTLTPSLRVDNHSTMGSAFGMAQFGKLTLSAHYGRGYFYHPRSVQTSEREMFEEPVNHLLSAVGSTKGTGMFQFGNIDGSYEFDDHNLLSFSAGIHGYSGRGNADNDPVMTSTAGERVYSYHQHTHSKQSHPNVNASVDYQHTFREDMMLTLSYRMNTSPGHDKTTRTYSDLYNIPYTLTDLYSNTKTNSDEHTGQADFTIPFSEAHKLSTGVKYIFRQNKSDNEEMQRATGSNMDFERDEDRSIVYRQRGHISAAYAEYNLKLGHVTAMAGTRYEYYQIRVTYPDGKRDAFKANLGDWVPSVSVGYNLSTTQMLKLGYNMRIERPGIGALSPYVVKETPELASYGNPNLKSAMANNIELGYSLFGTKFSFSPTLTYSFTNNGLTAYDFVDGNSVINTTFDNILHSKSINLGMFVSWNMTNTMRLHLNGGTNYRDLKVERMDAHNYGWHAHAWGGITQKLPWRLQTELWLGMHTKEVELQGRGSHFHMYSLNLSRQFLKDDRLQVSLRAGNFFDRYHHFKGETTTSSFRQRSDNRVDFLHIGMGIRYRFGSLKAEVKRAARSIENNDVQQSSGGQSGGGQDSSM